MQLAPKWRERGVFDSKQTKEDERKRPRRRHEDVSDHACALQRERALHAAPPRVAARDELRGDVRASQIPNPFDSI